MSFEFELTLYCDNGCGVSEPYDEAAIDCGGNEPELPHGWKKDYDNGDSIFGHVCANCVAEFKEDEDVKAV